MALAASRQKQAIFRFSGGSCIHTPALLSNILWHRSKDTPGRPRNSGQRKRFACNVTFIIFSTRLISVSGPDLLKPRSSCKIARLVGPDPSGGWREARPFSLLLVCREFEVLLGRVRPFQEACLLFCCMDELFEGRMNICMA